ncbi:MAG: hypothetical protein C0423_03235 [Methylibium sp.]|nr:hypothetical protein [Methylibium sp.]
MSIRLEVSDTVMVRVKGLGPVKENGSREPFDFSLICHRMGGDEFREASKDDERTVTDLLLEKVKGWTHVLDGEGAPVAFSVDGLRQLLRPLGMPGLVWISYLEACGFKGKEKN